MIERDRQLWGNSKTKSMKTTENQSSQFWEYLFDTTYPAFPLQIREKPGNDMSNDVLAMNIFDIATPFIDKCSSSSYPTLLHYGMDSNRMTSVSIQEYTIFLEYTIQKQW